MSQFFKTVLNYFHFTIKINDIIVIKGAVHFWERGHSRFIETHSSLVKETKIFVSYCTHSI